MGEDIVMKKFQLIICLLFASCTICACNIPKENTPKQVEEYEILSVSKYLQNETNGFGGIINTEIYYSFSYIDSDGKVIDEFGFPTWLVEVGDSDKYVKSENILYLTEETLKSIELKTKRWNDEKDRL